jgi:aminoglycoside/choline kinase family phosphotransferase
MHTLHSAFESIFKEQVIAEETITGSGSNRQYFRLKGKNHSAIAVIGEDIAENKAFIELTQHFRNQHLPVPELLYVSNDQTRYLQQDLGDISLFDFIKKGRESGQFNSSEREMLVKTIKELVKFQFVGAENLDFSLCYPQAQFDKRGILWDLNYFKYCFLKPSGVSFSENNLEDDFEKLAFLLLQIETNTFLYRDFQSRNGLIYNDKPYFIDYQGGRKGPIFYDVASFLWQAKANYPNEFRNELIDIYLSEIQQYITISAEEFKLQLKHFVLFRTLQVLGAYGYRGFFERKAHFIQSVPFAIQNLNHLLQTEDFSEYSYLISVLKKMCDESTQMTQIKRITTNKTNKNPSLHISIYSFSYKKGIPNDDSGNGGGYVFDCRFIHNPGRYEEYKQLTGLDQPVIDFLDKEQEMTDFLQTVYSLADKHIERYIERGFTHLMFSFGCTGGQHRSVYSAQHLADYIRQKYDVKVKLIHREQNL